MVGAIEGDGGSGGVWDGEPVPYEKTETIWAGPEEGHHTIFALQGQGP